MSAPTIEAKEGPRVLPSPRRITTEPATGDPRFSRVLARHGDAIAIFAFALGIRLAFSLLKANTYDKDEFVYLALGHDAGNGAVPYRDLPFFHPPGILALPARGIVAVGLAVAIAWAVMVQTFGEGHGALIAMQLPKIQATIRLMKRVSPDPGPILADRFEYAYLGGRKWIGHYFWDRHTKISAAYLEHHLKDDTVVMAGVYPPGFETYLNAHYRRIQIHDTRLWLTDEPVAAAG